MSKLTDYKPLTRNPNKGTQRGTGILEQSVRELGAGRSILVDKNGIILAGNHAQEAFVNAGMDDVIEVETDGKQIVVVKRTDLDADSSAGKKMAIMDNRTSEQGLAWDAVVVEDLLNEIKQDEGELDAYLESLAKDTGAVIGDEPPEDQGAQIDKAEELRVKWGVELGQLWQLGEHRLICGDCTDKAVVDRVMDIQPEIMVTDPPYGVNYDPSWREEAGVNKNKDKMGKVENDNNADWTPAWSLFSGDVAYVYHAGVMAGTVQNSLENCNLIIRSQIIWNKDRMALSRGDYHWKHEPCWYAVRGGKVAKRTEDRTQVTVWDIPARDDGGNGHGTQKPVECMERPIRNHEFNIVYDPFVGSGTTLIACERLNRKCRAVEISPAYCAVAIQRWVDMTGQEPVLLDK